jgi:N-dimethylarginine dimethylaminohydrolase
MKRRTPSFLMCAPEYYAIRYSINPWMKLTRQSDALKSGAQWKELEEILLRLGASIERLLPAPGLPDMVFTANGGLPVGKQVYLTRFRYKERQGETKYFRAWFKQKEYEVIEFPEDVFFEGAGDALFFGGTLFAGYRFRSDIRAHTLIAENSGLPVLSLELVDKRFYHLDTCFAPLDGTSALYYPPAFDRYARKVIEENVPDPIAVPAEEALRFVCNAVVVDKNIVMHHGSPRTAALLAERGFRVYETDLSEFLKAGGSAKCLTLQIGS